MCDKHKAVENSLLSSVEMAATAVVAVAFTLSADCSFACDK